MHGTRTSQCDESIGVDDRPLVLGGEGAYRGGCSSITRLLRLLALHRRARAHDRSPEQPDQAASVLPAIYLNLLSLWFALFVGLNLSRPAFTSGAR